MKMLGKLSLAGVVVFAALQLVRPGIPSEPATAELQAPPAVMHILEKDCYSCHSDQRRLAWFDEIVPAYWLVRHDILTAREHINFSKLGSKPPAVQRATLFEAANMIQLGAMPLPDFVKLHPEANVTPEERATLRTYLAPWSSAPPAPAPAEDRQPVVLSTVGPEFNGLPFDPAFETWRPISTTDRGDNNTFRFILGNDVAVQAAENGNIKPWPDGARFAKIAWQKETGTDGLVHPGKFVQVELMIKDAARYKNTEGWGWGRWRGLDLVPYGKDAQFVSECTSCHQPLQGDDYVYTLPIGTAKVSGNEVVNNAAALPKTLPYEPLKWRAITMYVDPRNQTTATLYGNDSMLGLVTWAQRDDPHWFGARIPATPRSVEFVQKGAVGHASGYRRFAGAELAEDHDVGHVATQRTDFLVGLAPARLP